jgi:hypothetical protein
MVKFADEGRREEGRRLDDSIDSFRRENHVKSDFVRACILGSNHRGYISECSRSREVKC